MSGKIFLKGDKINLRTIEKEDLEFLRDGVNHPEVRTHMLNRRPQNLEDEEDFFENVVKDDEGAHLLICRNEEPAGIVSLNQKDGESKLGEIGIWLHPDFHGKGYGTEASKLITDYGFDQLNYHKLYARAHKDNEPSQKIWEKLGFTEEGELRDHAYTEGEYKNVIYYGILEGERK